MSENFSLGIKFNIKSVKAPINEVYLTCIEGRSAFYKLKILPVGGITTVQVSYGRIGTLGKVNIKKFRTMEEAKKFFDSKKGEKMKKGYKIISSK